MVVGRVNVDQLGGAPGDFANRPVSGGDDDMLIPAAFGVCVDGRHDPGYGGKVGMGIQIRCVVGSAAERLLNPALNSTILCLTADRAEGRLN